MDARGQILLRRGDRERCLTHTTVAPDKHRAAGRCKSAIALLESFFTTLKEFRILDWVLWTKVRLNCPSKVTWIEVTELHS